MKKNARVCSNYVDIQQDNACQNFLIIISRLLLYLCKMCYNSFVCTEKMFVINFYSTVYAIHPFYCILTFFVMSNMEYYVI